MKQSKKRSKEEDEELREFIEKANQERFKYFWNSKEDDDVWDEY